VIRLIICGDGVPEANETVRVQLSNPANATIADGQGQATIVNDDPAHVSFTIDDLVINEGNTGPSTANFSVRLSAANPAGASVNCSTALAPQSLTPATDGVACNFGADFIRLARTRITFGPTETVKTCRVTICGDVVNEKDEPFLVNLSEPQGGSITDGTGVGTIKDND
jgi:hypothetical protein